MNKCCCINAASAFCAAVVASTACAGDVDRYDVSFAGVDYWSFDQGGIDPKSPNYNGQTVSGLEVGRPFTSAGCSGVESVVCWNTGTDFANWASEMQFAMTATGGTPESTGFYGVIAPYAGDDTGPATEGTCDPRTAPDEQVVDFVPFTFFVDDTGEVSVAIGSTYNDGTAQRAGSVNTADFFFELGGAPNTACVDGAGSCVESRPEPGCDDLLCCELVCDIDEVCCLVEWDSTCVSYAVDLCGLYQYDCEAPGPQANDCATSPATAENGVVYAFDTTGANTDGPDEVGCGSAGDDLPVWSDLWYMFDADVDGLMIATCCLDANFDTKIAAYNAGASGSTFNPNNLPSAFIGCNEDCDDPDFYTSELIVPVTGGNQYLIRLGGHLQATGTGNIRIYIDEPEPKIDPQVCDNPGDNPVTQSDTLDLTEGGVACAAGGISTENAFCRVYTKDELGGGDYQVNCINFGRANSGSYLPGIINLYKDPDGGDPGPMGNLELLASNEFGGYTTPDGFAPDTVSFGDQPVCVSLADGETLVVEMAHEASVDGFVTFGGGNANTPGSFVWVRTDSCGITEYITLESIGFTQQWTVELSGTASENCVDLSCSADLNDDGVVDGIDLGLVLGYWGCTGCPEDLNGDGTVDGGDMGILFAEWGTCPG